MSEHIIICSECSISERDGRYFEAEGEKLDSCADAFEIRMECEIKEACRTAPTVQTLEEESAEGKLEHKIDVSSFFAIRWRLQ